jgi:uroporphyrinogen-III synthase
MRAYVRAGPDLSQLCHGRDAATDTQLTSLTESPLPFSWIITKSQPHADSLVIQLRRQAFDARAVCCIEHQWREWPELRQLGAAGAALLFVTSRAAAARVEVPHGALVAAIAPATSTTLEARGIKVSIVAHGGVRELARAVSQSSLVADGAEVFYPTSDAALRQPEHLAAVATLNERLRVRAEAVYATVAPPNLAHELAALHGSNTPLGFVFWSPSAIGNFSAAGGFELPPGPAVLVGGSTLRSWRESAPPAWRRAYSHDAETPLEWSLRFLDRGAEPGASS